MCGFKLQGDEVKLKYAFDANVKDAAADFDAHSDGEVSSMFIMLLSHFCLDLKHDQG